MARRKLTEDEVSSVLKAVNRVLKHREIDQPVQLTFTAAAPGLCWKRVCRTLPGGRVVCNWVQGPC